MQPVPQGKCTMQILSDQEHVPPGECHLSPRRYCRFIGDLSDANKNTVFNAFVTKSCYSQEQSIHLGYVGLKPGAI